MIQNLKQPQVSAVKLREWQRYRGWTLKFLEELEHSGGMTTREISDRTGCTCGLATNRLCKMLRRGLVEKAESWGWRITIDGLTVLNINYTASSQQQHSNNTASSQQQEKEEPAPSCFHTQSCHIKKICKDKKFTSKNMTLCQNCVWDSPAAWKVPDVPMEKKGAGVIYMTEIKG